MKIAIHNTKEISFTQGWINYCEKNNIEYRLVNAYDSNIVDQVKDCTAFMWHHSQVNYKDALFAKQLLYSLEHKGMKVFPNFNTTWHFDDKVGQKYLLEAIEAPLVPSYVFYTKKEALEWINKTTFPKVFKLRGGAGSAHVKLARTKSQAKGFIKKAFGCGFSQLDKIGYLKDKYRKWREGKDKLGLIKGLYRLFIKTEFAKMYHNEKGYIYFQDFIPNNSFDIRIVVVGDKAMAEKRFVRKNDFRASGSGEFSYDDINTDAIKIAFDVAEKLKLQSVAFDFILDNNKPLIVEMSYGFGVKGISNAPGYWDRDLNWHKGENFDFYGWMIELVR